MSPPKHYPIRTKLLACAGLTTVQIISSTVLKLANSNGKYKFSPQSSLVMSETIKFLLSLLYHLQHSPSLRAARRALSDQTSRSLTFNMAALAAIYCLNNTIMFWLFARADPGSITLVKSAATVVSAVMLYLSRGFRLSLVRCVAIFLQMLGLIVAQYDACVGNTHLPPLVYTLLLLSLFNSSLANVWNEHVIKSFESASLATKNLYLYLFGALFNLVIFLRDQMRDPSTPGFFEGYGWAAMGVVVSNAFMGIAINVVYKYADALVKNIATTSTTVVLLILSAAFFDGRGDVMVFIGAAVVVLATFLYFALGMGEQRLAELRKQLGDNGEVSR